MVISAGEFKAKCLKLMDNVNKTHEEIVITKFGRPVAKLVPIDDDEGESLYGFLKESVVIYGDITEPTGEKWDAEG